MKWKLIQSIIYKKTSSKLAFEVFLKINIQKKSQKTNPFVFLIKKIPCVTFFELFPYAFIFHIKTHFFVNLIRVLNSMWIR
jgi:hypothetical protein